MTVRRGTLRRWVIGLVASAFVAVSGWQFVEFMDLTFESSYPSLKAAVDDGAVVRGWIPEWLPASTFDIREIHDLDSNHVSIMFKFDRTDRSWVNGHAAAMTNAEVKGVQVPGIAGEWWPETMPVGADWYGCGSNADHATAMVVDWRTGTAYYWSQSRSFW